jgi:hypothetical protein
MAASDLEYVIRTQLMEASVNNLIQQLVEGDYYWPITPAEDYRQRSQARRQHCSHDLLRILLPLVLRDRVLDHGRAVHVAKLSLAVRLSGLFKQWRHLRNARRC